MTTIVLVRKNKDVVVASDGQVSMGNTVIKRTANKVRKIEKRNVIAGFAGSTADALTLFERLEAKIEKHAGNLSRAAVELAKDWRTDKYLRRLEALKKALKKSVGIRRYAHAMIPMDETLSRVAIDISNRPYLIWKVNLKVEKLGEMDTELFKEWFQAFSQAAGITLHVENIYGDNSHHIIESCVKGLARSLRTALEIYPRNKKSIPSTKGSL